MVVRSWLCILVPWTFAALAAAAPAPPRAPGWLTRQEAQADLAQLRTLLETSHPDPYLRAGGMVAFRRRFALAERGLPADGLDRAAFLDLLEPLVAQVRDAHTALWVPDREDGQPIFGDWVPVDGRLVVTQVYGQDQRPALGAALISVEGVPVADLLERMARRRGYENLYDNLNHLAGALKRVGSLERLLGRSLSGSQVRCQVQGPDGALRTLTLPIGPAEPAGAFAPPRSLRLPAPDIAGLASGFLDPEGQTAYFALTSAMRYREAFEGWESQGNARLADLEALVGPEGTAAEKRGRLPSVTERLQALVTDMKARKTSRLIVDLRANRGGNSAFTVILAYFLYPLAEVAAPRLDGYQVIRYSPLYFQNRPHETLDSVRARGTATLQMGDLDFRQEEAWRATQAGPATPSAQASWLRDATHGLPTFARAVAEGRWNASWRPRVVVLTSAATFSAGFDGVLQLRQLGAQVVGVPSAQAANCFIDMLPFRLQHSGIQGGLSFKWSVGLPDDPASGELLRPDLELTYDRFRSLAFDPDAALILALREEVPARTPRR